MVALRSTRQDRALLVAVWALTLVVLGVGIATLNPILLLWGAVGLPGAIFLTRIHVRDTRRAGPSDNTPDGTNQPSGAGDAAETDAAETKESPR